MITVAKPYESKTGEDVEFIKDIHDIVVLKQGDTTISVSGSDLFSKLVDAGYGDPVAEDKTVPSPN